MGRPQGRESRKVIIDLKTGRVSQRHREDLRFYALVETLVRDVPPRKLATFYLDSAEPIVEDVTEGVLRTALRRTLDGIHRLIQLQIEGEVADQEAGHVVPLVPVPRRVRRGAELPAGRRRRDRTVIRSSGHDADLVAFLQPIPHHLTLLGQHPDAARRVTEVAPRCRPTRAAARTRRCAAPARCGRRSARRCSRRG